jgi:hypothetical protein
MQGGARLKKVLVLFLIVTALVAGAALVACGGGDKNKEEKTTPVAQETKEGNGGEETPTAKETPAAEATKEEGGGGGDSLGDIPVYPGATKITSGEWSGSEAPIPAIGGGENPSDYGTVKYGMYETGDSPDEVFNWYKDKMSGWKEEWIMSSSGEGAGSIGVWSKDDGKTAGWVTVSAEGGKTSLTIMAGTQ